MLLDPILTRFSQKSPVTVMARATLERALDGIAAWMETQGWRVVGTMESPIEGGDGNREFLLAARKAE